MAAEKITGQLPDNDIKPDTVTLLNDLDRNPAGPFDTGGHSPAISAAVDWLNDQVHEDHGHDDAGHEDHGHEDDGHEDHGHEDDGHEDHGHDDM